MIDKFNLLKDVGCFVYKYRNFCKSIDSNRLNPIEWDTKKMESCFNFHLLEEMILDEQKLLNKIQKHKNLNIKIKKEQIEKLIKKYECI